LIHRRILLESGFRSLELVLKGQEPRQKEPVMGRAGRPTVAIELTDEEREMLVRWSRRHSSSQALALRSRVVLACADGRPNTKIADELSCDGVTVGRWRHQFAAEGLVDAPKPGAARTISDEVVEAVVVETLETTPKDATHWSTRSIAQRHGISRPTVSETWRAFGLKPWRQDEFKISPDPDLIEKNRDLVGLYLWLLRHSRFHFHFTPTYGSWMNRRAMVLSPDPPRRSNAPRTAASKRSPRTSATGSRPGTTTPDPSPGTRAPRRSSTDSPATAAPSTTSERSNLTGH
jgi:transposase